MYTPAASMQAARLRDRFGSYLVAQLSAEPALHAETEFFRGAQQRLTAGIEEHARARNENLQALAARDRAHQMLDDAVRFFGFSVRASTLHDARSPLYRHYFPEGTPRVTRSPLATTVQKVSDILAKLATEQRGSLTAHIGPLTSALDTMRTAIAARDEATRAQSSAWAALVQGKRHWRDAYQQVHARLRLHFHDEPRRAEVYFRRVRAWRTADAGAESAIQDAPANVQATGAGGAAPPVIYRIMTVNRATASPSAAKRARFRPGFQVSRNRRCMDAQRRARRPKGRHYG